MRRKRKRQVMRDRPITYRRGTDLYGVEYVLVSRRGEAPEARPLAGKQGRRVPS